MAGSNTVRSPHYGALQDVVDSLYLGLGPKEKLRRLDIPTTWPRSSTCCRPAATRASAYATS